jgi:hypothetical protein
MTEAQTSPQNPQTPESLIQIQPPFVSLNGMLYVDLADWNKTDFSKKLITQQDLERYV